ncbi:MAG: hypothetical protein U9O66_00035, partial [Patescibacteria group bacterium]|nr:hypothetical protein [Patescibacteria group bacterium]
ENCGIAVIGFEFDSGKGKCVKKTGSCKVKTPFNTLEECQEVCEETQPRFDFYSCNQNSDCISVKKDCCGCTAGGSAIAINKKFRDKWHKKFDCGRIMCPAVMSNDLSCFQEPKCAEKSGKCLLRDGVMVD